MRRIMFVLGVAVLGLLAGRATGQRDGLPLLHAPIGLGVIYSEAAPGAEPVIDALWQRALREGANAYQLAVPWDEIARPDGTPDLSFVRPLLDTLELAGLQVFFTLQSVDTTRLRLPANLLDPTDPSRLRPGLSFDSPEVIVPLIELLDELAPLLASKGCFAMSLANEVNIWLSAHPDQALPLATFAEFGRLRVHAVAPGLACGVTLTREALEQPELTALVAAVSDAIIVAYYPIDGVVLPTQAVVADFDTIEALAAGKPIILQEVGCPSGPVDGGPSVIGASPGLQRDWVRAVFTEVRRRESIRFVSWLHLADWPEDVVSFFEAYYGYSDPGFLEFLSTLGVSSTDGVPKPAAGELLRQLRRTSVLNAEPVGVGSGRRAVGATPTGPR
ncbi:MAG: hypothetical protein ACTS22_00515 [Phycisphaerales bacterium]